MSKHLAWKTAVNGQRAIIYLETATTILNYVPGLKIPILVHVQPAQCNCPYLTSEVTGAR